MPIHFKYASSLPNEPIAVAEGAVTVPYAGGTVEGVGKVLLRLLPDPSWTIEAEFPFPPLVHFDLGTKLAVTFADRNLTFEATVSHSPIRFGQGQASSTVFLDPPNPLHIGHLEKLAEVRIGVINFPNFRAQPFLVDLPSGGRTTCYGVELSANGWHILLESLPNTEQKINSLKATGGYAITHVGSIEKAGDEFTTAEAEEVLHALHEFLSFACGRWTAPILATGFNQAGDAVWEEWGTRLVSPWKPVLSWFDWDHGLELANAFPGFMRKWDDSTWREVISTTIYWYLRGNLGAGPDGGIILAQAALERLAWMLLVEQKRCLSGDGFKRVPDADWLRLLLTDAGIPLSLPAELKQMAALAKGLGWQDGPAAVSEVRNYLVHASGKTKDLPFVEAWHLTQFYLELVLLRLCEYSGAFGNRTGPLPRWRGTVDLVPWAQ